MTYFRPRIPPSMGTRRGLVLIIASSASSSDYFSSKGEPPSSSKKSILWNLIRDIEPLDVSVIQKDVPTDIVDAMKRTISGILGVLPSDHFNITVESQWDPLFKLLISSMTTRYTLCNAEYRLCLERNLDMCDDLSVKKKENIIKHARDDSAYSGNPLVLGLQERNDNFDDSQSEEPIRSENKPVEEFGEMSSEAQEYIQFLQSRLSSLKMELHDMKSKNAALQMQQFVGEEKNDLLNYLRSLQPEKVAELSEIALRGLQDIIHSVAHGLLATLSPRMRTRAPSLCENAGEMYNVGKADCGELIEDNTSLQFQPLVSVSRDYLARLLF